MTIGILVTVIVSGYFVFYRQKPEALVIAPKTPERIVTLTVKPSSATVSLDGRSLGPPDASGKLDVPISAGESSFCWLEVSAEGYHSIRRPLSSFSGTEDISIELVRTPYEVEVRTTPPRAEIWVDNQMKGYSPLRLTFLPTEKPTITAKHEGFKPVSQQVAAPDQGNSVEIDLPLTVTNVVVQVQTEPPGAMIAMDGVVRGPSPLAVEMDQSYLGKDVEITATLEGYERASMQIAVPNQGKEGAVPARLSLVRRKPEVEFWTTPPGGHIVVDGNDMGVAPVVVKFKPSQVGTSVVVSAALAGTHYGRQELTVPPIGEPLRLTIPMEFNAKKVVIILSCPKGAPNAESRADASAAAKPAPRATAAALSEVAVLAEEAVEVVHALNGAQRFALLIDTDDGVEAWPAPTETEAASSEQKVRAYDMIRSTRSPGESHIAEAISTSLGFEPDTIWLFSTGELARADVEQLNDWTEDHDVALHIVRGFSQHEDEWLRQWTADHRSTLTVLGRDPLPTMALGQGNE